MIIKEVNSEGRIEVERVYYNSFNVVLEKDMLCRWWTTSVYYDHDKKVLVGTNGRCLVLFNLQKVDIAKLKGVKSGTFKLQKISKQCYLVPTSEIDYPNYQRTIPEYTNNFLSKKYAYRGTMTGEDAQFIYEVISEVNAPICIPYLKTLKGLGAISGSYDKRPLIKGYPNTGNQPLKFTFEVGVFMLMPLNK